MQRKSHLAHFYLVLNEITLLYLSKKGFFRTLKSWEIDKNRYNHNKELIQHGHRPMNGFDICKLENLHVFLDGDKYLFMLAFPPFWYNCDLI